MRHSQDQSAGIHKHGLPGIYGNINLVLGLCPRTLTAINPWPHAITNITVEYTWVAESGGGGGTPPKEKSKPSDITNQI